MPWLDQHTGQWKAGTPYLCELCFSRPGPKGRLLTEPLAGHLESPSYLRHPWCAPRESLGTGVQSDLLSTLWCRVWLPLVLEQLACRDLGVRMLSFCP